MKGFFFLLSCEWGVSPEGLFSWFCRVEEWNPLVDGLTGGSQPSGAASDVGNQSVGQRAVAERPTYLERSNTFPGLESRFPSREEARKLNAWWTRSNWAFLNEPPLTEMEGPAYKYAAQYHIAAPSSRDGVASMS